MSDQSPVFESPVFHEADDEVEDLDDLDETDEADETDETDEGGSGGSPEGGHSLAVLEHVARSLVDDPEAVRIEVHEGRSGRTLSLRVAPGDMGRVIGKRGRIAQALRVVVRAAGARDGSEASVDIVD